MIIKKKYDLKLIFNYFKTFTNMIIPFNNHLLFCEAAYKKNTVTSSSTLHNLSFFHLTFSVQTQLHNLLSLEKNPPDCRCTVHTGTGKKKIHHSVFLLNIFIAFLRSDQVTWAWTFSHFMISSSFSLPFMGTGERQRGTIKKCDRRVRQP